MARIIRHAQPRGNWAAAGLKGAGLKGAGLKGAGLKGAGE
jgi:hypothetical protein